MARGAGCFAGYGNSPAPTWPFTATRGSPALHLELIGDLGDEVHCRLLVAGVPPREQLGELGLERTDECPREAFALRGQLDHRTPAVAVVGSPGEPSALPCAVDEPCDVRAVAPQVPGEL